MKCEHARLILLSKQETSLIKSSALRHVHDCHECKVYLAHQERFDTALSNSLTPIQMPPKLRERILSSIAASVAAPEERKKTARRFVFCWPALRLPFRLEFRYALGGALLSSTLLLLVMLYKSESDRRSALNEAFVSDYFEYLPKERPEELNSSAPDTIEKWFQGKIAFALHVPHLQNANLLGARLCILKGARSALLFYKIADIPVSLFVMDANIKPRGPTQYLSKKTQSAQITSTKGLNLVSWEGYGAVYTLVSPLDIEQMKGAISKEVSNT